MNWLIFILHALALLCVICTICILAVCFYRRVCCYLPCCVFSICIFSQKDISIGYHLGISNHLNGNQLIKKVAGCSPSADWTSPLLLHGGQGKGRGGRTRRQEQDTRRNANVSRRIQSPLSHFLKEDATLQNIFWQEDEEKYKIVFTHPSKKKSAARQRRQEAGHSRIHSHCVTLQDITLTVCILVLHAFAQYTLYSLYALNVLNLFAQYMHRGRRQGRHESAHSRKWGTFLGEYTTFSFLQPSWSKISGKIYKLKKNFYRCKIARERTISIYFADTCTDHLGTLPEAEE